MYYYGEVVEGTIRISSSTILNTQSLPRTLYLRGKFMLFGLFVEYTTTKGETVYMPVNGIIMFKLIDYIGILSVFNDPSKGIDYAYFSLVPKKTLEETIKLFKFFNVFKEDLSKEIRDYEIELP